MQSSHCNFVRKDTNFTHIKTLQTRIDNDFYYFCSEIIHKRCSEFVYIKAGKIGLQQSAISSQPWCYHADS